MSQVDLDVDVAIIGAGISGLSAARALSRQGLRVRVIERKPRCGGVIRTTRVGDCVVDVGPDALLGHKPAALALCRELGLDDQLIAPRKPRTTYLVQRGRLQPLPETSLFGLPADWLSLARSRAFSWPGKLRMAAEGLLPRGGPVARGARTAHGRHETHAAANEGDESIAAFVRRRFGREAVRSLAEPLLAGIHRGDAARLSMRALFPMLVDAERQHGSILRALARRGPAGPRGSVMSLRGGLGQLVDRLVSTLPADTVMTDTAVTAIEDRGPLRYRLTLSDDSSLTATAVLLATPPHVTARLVESLDPELSRLCGAIEAATCLTVVLAYARDAVRHPLNGWGFVVPARERRRIHAATWVSSKWTDRAPSHEVLIRAAIGRVDRPAPRLSDVELIGWADDELRDLLGIDGAPVAAKVFRWPGAMPQLQVGHLDRLRAIERRLEQRPGLFVSAAGFRGVGIPDCIAGAQTEADAAAAYVRSRSAQVAPAVAADAAGIDTTFDRSSLPLRTATAFR